jgi:branched-chain amino acid transport system permease protein
METIASLVVAGLAVGAIYAFSGLGFVFTYRSIGTFNFFHGELAMVAAVTAALLLMEGVPLWFGIVGGVVCGVAIALLGERVIVRRLNAESSLAVMLATAAFGIFILRGIAEATFGPDPRSFPPLVDGTLRAGELVVRYQDILVLVVFAATLGGLSAMFRYSQIGRAMRAVGDNPEAARIVGIRLGTTRALAFALAGMLGAIGGILFAPVLSVTPDMGGMLTLKAFVVALVGGLMSFSGAVTVGLALGVAEALLAYYWDANLRDLVAFSLMLVALLLFPGGVWSPREVERV